MNGKYAAYSLDRIDNEGDYAPRELPLGYRGGAIQEPQKAKPCLHFLRRFYPGNPLYLPSLRPITFTACSLQRAPSGCSPMPVLRQASSGKQICSERVRALQEAKNNGTRPHRRGYWRQDNR